MWSWRAWKRQRTLRRHAITDAQWACVRQAVPILHGLASDQDRLLRERSLLFLADKTLTTLDGLVLDDHQCLLLAAQAQLPLLALGELGWYRGFHQLVLYPGDFLSPQRYRDPSGVEHEYHAEHSGEAWEQGPVIFAWSGVEASGGWDGYNLVIHELAHKLDMLNGEANGLPPLHRGMRVAQWAQTMQQAFDDLNRQLDADEQAETAIDPYAAENPAEFFAVASEYFFSAPDLLMTAYPAVYEQLQAFYRQHPLDRLRALEGPAVCPRGATAGRGRGPSVAPDSGYAYNPATSPSIGLNDPTVHGSTIDELQQDPSRQGPAERHPRRYRDPGQPRADQV